jgi:hypothetical protein
MTPSEVRGLQALAMAKGGSLTINPETGLPEAGFLSDLFKATLPMLAGAALGPAGLGLVSSGLGAAAVVGGVTGLATGSLQKGLMAGLGAYGGYGLSEGLTGIGSSLAGAQTAGALSQEALQQQAAQQLGAGATAEQIAALQNKLAQDAVQKSVGEFAAKPWYEKVGAGLSYAKDNPLEAAKAMSGPLMAAAAPIMAGQMVPTTTQMPAFRSAPSTAYLRPMSVDFSPQNFGKITELPVVPLGKASGGMVSFDEGGDVQIPETITPMPGEASQAAYDYLMGRGPYPVRQRLAEDFFNLYTPPEEVKTAIEAIKPIGAGDGSGGTLYGAGTELTDSNPAWSNMTNAEKAAYYAANPTMAAITQAGQKAFGLTALGAAQNALVPNFVAEQGLVARGINPNPSFAFVPSVDAGYFSGLEGLAAQALASGVGDEAIAAANQAAANQAAANQAAAAAPSGAQSFGVSDVYGAITGGVNAADGVGMSGFDSTGNVGADSGSSGGYGSGDGDGGGLWARGGITALARGGYSHLGDYSDGGRLLRGPGDGVSDSIPATIANKRPARLADGEFVVPARIVSELGNGSTEAGARKLYAMMDRIQRARRKSVGKGKVAVNSRTEKYLPA